MKMPRWKMLDVVWLDHYWRPHALIVGIHRTEIDPNVICYDCVNESECTNYHGESECLTEREWRTSIECYLRDEYTPREWRARMETIAEFKEPPSWEAFRRRFRETGDPYRPWVINGKEVRPTWRVDETFPCDHRDVTATEDGGRCNSCKVDLEYDAATRNWVRLGGGGGVLVGSETTTTGKQYNDEALRRGEETP